MNHQVVSLSWVLLSGCHISTIHIYVFRSYHTFIYFISTLFNFCLKYSYVMIYHDIPGTNPASNCTYVLKIDRLSISFWILIKIVFYSGYYCPASSILVPTTIPSPCPVSTFGEREGLTHQDNCTTCTGGNYCDGEGTDQEI